MLISRGTWEVEYGFCGHQGPVLATAASPRMYYRKIVKDGKVVETDEAENVVAIGSTDKTFSVWKQDVQPIAVVARCFEKGIADLAWCDDGYTLLAASFDGQLAVVEFNEHVLGRVVPVEEVAGLVEAKYGGTGGGEE